jgi:hypothetical protein
MFIGCGIRRICARGLAGYLIVNAISGLGEERQAFGHIIHNVSDEKSVDGMLSKANW